MYPFQKKDTKQHFLTIYFANFFFAFHFALPIYIDSAFLNKFLDAEVVGLIYAVASFLTILFVANSRKIIQALGNRRTILLFVSFEIFSLLALAFFTTPIFLVLVFILRQLLLNTIYFNIDLLLESISSDTSTGHIRGVFLTITNTAILAAPFVGGLLLGESEAFSRIYLAAAVALVPILFLVNRGLQGYRDPEYHNVSFGASLAAIYKNKNLYAIFACSFLLQFFFAWMVIYTPIYLHEEVGFSFGKILGVIMPIALLPFALFEFVLGRLADEKWGEKEILTIGFIVTGLTTIALTFITSTSLLVWTLALFFTRVGATFIEIMVESYFYKQISGKDIQIISDFRNIRPVGYLIAPIIGTFFLSILDFPLQGLFAVLGLIMLLGLHYSLSLKDTK